MCQKAGIQPYTARVNRIPCSKKIAQNEAITYASSFKYKQKCHKHYVYCIRVLRESFEPTSLPINTLRTVRVI